MKKSTVSFNEAWNQSQELIEDQEFCDEFVDDDEKKKQLTELIDSWGLSVLNMDEFIDLSLDASREYYNAEYASEAPGDRSSHRSESKKYESIARNRLRVVFGKEPKGVSEREEIVDFLTTHKGDMNRSSSKKVQELLQTTFGFTKSMSYDLIGVGEDMFGKKNNDASGWNSNILEYAGIQLSIKRKK